MRDCIISIPVSFFNTLCDRPKAMEQSDRKSHVSVEQEYTISLLKMTNPKHR